MSQGLSPSVDISEQEFQIANVATGVNFSAFAGAFKWGAVEEIKTITDEPRLAAVFGKPDDDNYEDWLPAASYLAYNDKLRVVRAAGDESMNAGLEVFSETLYKTSVKQTVLEVTTGEGNEAVTEEVPQSFDLVVGETVTGRTSEATGKIVLIDTVDTTHKVVYIKLIGETEFEADEIIDGATSESMATIETIEDSTNHPFKDYRKNSNSVMNISNDEFIKFKFLAKYCGELGNNISVAFANSQSFGTAYIYGTTTFKSQFDFAPTTNEIALVVLKDGKIEEKHILSLIKGTKNYKGENIYISDFLEQNSKSQLILCFDNYDQPLNLASMQATALTGGYYEMPDASDYNRAYNLFKNRESIDIDTIWCARAADILDGITVVQHIIDNITDVRKDCRSIFTARLVDVVNVDIETALNNLIAYIGTIGRDSSYAAFYGNAKYMWDNYNSVYRWVSLAGDVAGIYSVGNMWQAPAGLTRGVIKNIVKLAISPDEPQRDTIYPSGVNPVYTDVDSGSVVFGQKTLKTSTESIFNRVDNRGLFILLEKTVRRMVRFYQFDKNSPSQRKRLLSDITPIFEDIKGVEGLGNYILICDKSNNVDGSNTMHLRCRVQVLGSTEWIDILFEAVADSVNFEEIENA